MIKIGHIIELAKYAMVGVIVTLFNYLLFLALIYIGCNYIISNICAYITAVSANFFLNDKFVFNSESSSKSKVLKYIISRIGLLSAECVLLYVIVELFQLPVQFCKAIVVVVLLIVNFFLSKWVVFK